MIWQSFITIIKLWYFLPLPSSSSSSSFFLSFWDDLYRDKNTGNMGSKEENGGERERYGSVLISSLWREVFSSKKKSSKKFSWTKQGGGGGKASDQSDQEECVVCLEGFKSGELLVHLPCTHRYHSGCLVPWIETNSHCPYCRTEIST